MLEKHNNEKRQCACIRWKKKYFGLKTDLLLF